MLLLSGNTEGKAYIFDCQYSTLCRQVVTDDEGRAQEFDFLTDNARVKVMSTADEDDDTSYGIDSIGILKMIIGDVSTLFKPSL